LYEIKKILFQKILQPFTYILKSPGHGVPAKLAQAFNYWLNVPADMLGVFQEVFQLYHVAGIL
jgi:geranylgeranyl diphosphate synthase type 3